MVGETGMKKLVMGSIMVVCVSLSACPGSAQAQSPAPGQRLFFVEPVTLGRGSYPSPDGRFEVFVQRDSHDQQVVFQLAPRTNLISRGKTKAVKQGFHFGPNEDKNVNAFVWIPHHAHPLALVVKPSTGASSLLLWDGGAAPQLLFRGRSTNQEDSDAEYLALRGVSRDGSRLYYSYLKFTFDKEGYPVEKNERKLPIIELKLTPGN